MSTSKNNGRDTSRKFYVIEGSPINRDSRHATLSYLSTHSFKPGSIVEAPLRSKTKPFLVTECNDARNLKSRVRTQSFQLKKIKNEKPLARLSPSFFNTLLTSARYHITSPGSILYHTLPSFFWKGELSDIKSTIQKNEGGKFEELFLQKSSVEIVREYQRIIRESFALDQSVMIVAPTRTEAEELHETLKQSIEERMILLTSRITKKKQQTIWKKISRRTEALCLITTSGFLGCIPHSLRMIILHNEHSPHHTSPHRPFISTKHLLLSYAKERGLPLIYTSPTPSLKLFARYEGKLSPKLKALERPLTRIEGRVAAVLVDMKKYDDKKIRIFSNEAAKAINEALHEEGRIFVLAPRLGLFPSTVCDECGETVACPTDQYPLTLTEIAGHREYVCKLCGEKYDTNIRCAKCRGWRLSMLGVGIEKVNETLTELFPSTPLFHISSLTGSEKNHRDAMEKFENTPGSILLGTQAALPLLPPIHTAILPSLDPLLSIPDLHINEEIFNLITTIRHRTRRSLVVQSRARSIETLKDSVEGRFDRFVDRELKKRKNLSLPPFSTFIAVRREGKVGDLQSSARDLYKRFREFNPQFYPLKPSTRHRKHGLQMLIRIPLGEELSDNLIRLLYTLPQYYEIDRDPYYLFL